MRPTYTYLPSWCQVQ